MKYLLLIVLLACNRNELPEEYREMYQIRINVHNSVVRTKFFMDSLDEVSSIKKRHLDLSGTEQLDKYIESHMVVFASKWNDPYQISKDRFLTMDKYLHYCKAHNYDPVEYIEYLR